MEKMKKVTGFRLQVTVLLSLLVVLSITYNLFPITLFAQQPASTIQFSPTSADLKIGEEKIISISLNSGNAISGFDLKFTSSGGLLLTDFRDQPSFDNNFDLFNAKNVAREISGSNSRLSYIFTAPSSNLPKTVTIYAKIKASSGGQGNISLDYNNSQVLDGSGQALTVAPLSATYNLNPQQSSATFLAQSALPQIKYPDSAAAVNLKLKLAGAMANPKVPSIKAIAVAVGRVGESKFETPPQTFDLTQNTDGTYSGRVAFPNFKDGTKFSLMIKADKYLLKRICNPAPSENKLQGYRCTDPALTIRQGTNSFDFSGINLIPGDLGLTDGVLNGYDLSLVLNNLGKNDKAGIADLNYDQIVDQKDLEIISFAAGNTNRKADQ